MDVYKQQELYTDGFKAGYAQAIADADIALRTHGDSFIIRGCRRDVLALANVSYDPLHAMPVPDWSKYTVLHPKPYSAPATQPVGPGIGGGGMAKDLSYLAAIDQIARLRAALKPFADMATVALRTPGDCAFGTMTVEINYLLFAKGVFDQCADTQAGPQEK